MKVKIYTTDNCSFCEAAKKLMKSRGIAFEEIHLKEDADWEALTKRTGMRTAPQIFAGEKLIGGFDDLNALDKKDKLASLGAGA